MDIQANVQEVLDTVQKYVTSLSTDKLIAHIAIAAGFVLVIVAIFLW
ncbi:MAG: hypothetical protein V1725_08070 [archaeon]